MSVISDQLSNGTHIRETLGGVYVLLFADALATYRYVSGRFCDRTF
jgi:hypothetical protein